LRNISKNTKLTIFSLSKTVIKNSWGTSWVIDGYLYLPRGENKCNVQTMIGVPIGE